jgi:hypothetical protein
MVEVITTSLRFTGLSKRAPAFDVESIVYFSMAPPIESSKCLLYLVGDASRARLAFLDHLYSSHGPYICASHLKYERLNKPFVTILTNHTTQNIKI